MDPMLTTNEAVEVAKKVASAVQPVLPASEVWLFGSYAKGLQRPASDIDVAIIVPRLPESPDTETPRLDYNFWAVDVVSAIDWRISPHIVENELDRSGFVNNILDTGILVSEATADVNEPHPDVVGYFKRSMQSLVA